MFRRWGSTFAVVAGFCCESGRILPVVFATFIISGLCSLVAASLQLPARHNVAGEPALTADPPEHLPLPAETVRLHPPQRPKPPPRAQQQHGARHGLPALPLRIVLHRQPLPRLLTYLRILPCQWQWRRQRQRRWQLPFPARPLVLAVLFTQLAAHQPCQAARLQLHRAVVTRYLSTGFPGKNSFCTSSCRASRVPKTKLHLVGCSFPSKPHWHAGTRTKGWSAECRDE